MNIANGKFEAYAIVGGPGTSKTRFLGEIVEQWDRLRALSADDTRGKRGAPSRAIPPDTLAFPIGFNFETPVTDVDRGVIDLFLRGKGRLNYEVDFLAHFLYTFQ